MTPRIRFIRWVASLILFCPVWALADSKPFGECRAGYWSSNRNLDDTGALASSTCLVDWKGSLADAVRAGANLRLQHGWRAGNAQFSGRLREAYLRTELGSWTLSAGRQVTVWGRSDRISPTDVLGSRDFTVRTGDDDEQRNGADSVLLRWHANEAVAVSAMALRFEPNRLPTGQLPDVRADPIAPSRAEFALRVERTGPGLDTALSYFDGFDKAQRFWFGLAPGTTVGNAFRSTHERIRMWGLDAATSSGRWTLRGELAITRASADCDSCGLAARTISRAVLGIDRDLLDTANINVQYFGVRRTGYIREDNQPAQAQTLARGLNRLNSEFAPIERGVTVRMANRFLNDRTRVEFSGIFDLTQSSRLVRGRLVHSISDPVKLSVGFDRFSGKEQSYFGARQKNSAIWAELGWVF